MKTLVALGLLGGIGVFLLIRRRSQAQLPPPADVSQLFATGLPFIVRR